MSMPNSERRSPDEFIEEPEPATLGFEVVEFSESFDEDDETGEDPEDDEYEEEDEDAEGEDEAGAIVVELPEMASLPQNDSKSWRFKDSEDEIVGLLKRGVFGNLKLVPWGSNYTFIAPLWDEKSQREVAVIYKPVRGEAPLWDFPSGTLYKREHGAYLVSRALGWNFIPPVIIRDGPHGVGTAQLFVDVDEKKQYYDYRHHHSNELQRIAVFDYITNNADRKAGHCLLGNDGYIWGIDHGLCFNTDPKLRTIIWEFAGEPLPDDLYDDLLELATNSERLHKLTNQLGELLTQREVNIFLSRLERVLENPVFPSLNSRRQIPWEFF
ncbi:MAG: SCO1664 family protein [Chloroflexi bacterium]|nr:SCO1664 family protein [Chloroflexota bacterium]